MGVLREEESESAADISSLGHGRGPFLEIEKQVRTAIFTCFSGSIQYAYAQAHLYPILLTPPKNR